MPLNSNPHENFLRTPLRVGTAIKSILAKEIPFLKCVKKSISFFKNFHPDKGVVARLALELGYRINWSKTQIVSFEIGFK